jgi:regulator of protease activity HflC (stomatin/prohibitin superfamily)
VTSDEASSHSSGRAGRSRLSRHVLDLRRGRAAEGDGAAVRTGPNVKEDPGLGFKIPFIQNVVSTTARIQGIETVALEVTPLDDRRLIVDAFARWRISDVEQFRRAVGAGGMQAAESGCGAS